MKLLLLLLCFVPNLLFAQNIGFPGSLYSRAERSHFTETSLHSDVMQFVQTLADESQWVQLETLGTSKLGKEIPLVIMANPRITSPEEALVSGKPVFYIQANIHGGEVEGKEAVMQIMREIAFENLGYLLDNQILLFCPLFNPDGNDALGPNNRPNQDGSPRLTGQRSNGEGYDLNRDGLKLETLEVKALVANVINRWNPLMFVDLHTTNGTWHGYSITYAPGLATAGHPGVQEYLDEEVLPYVTEKVRERAGYDTFYYGDFYEYPPKKFHGMYPEPRYLTNAMALKNRLAILVETFSHDRFERRVSANVSFILTLLEYTNTNASSITDLIVRINRDVITQIEEFGGTFHRGVQFGVKEPGVTGPLLTYEVSGGKRTGRRVWYPSVEMLFSYQAVRSSTVPKAYLFPAELTAVAAKLQEHGIIVGTLGETASFQGEEFSVIRLNRTSQSYQGHYRASLDGNFESAYRSFPAGTYYVDMAQPYAFLIFYLLEPEADDGLVHWNYFDDFLEARNVGANPVPFPVFKVLQGGSLISEEQLGLISRIFPNPVSDQVYVTLARDTRQPVSVWLTDGLGQILLRKDLPAGTEKTMLDVRSISAGIYTLMLESGNQVTHHRLIVGGKDE